MFRLVVENSSGTSDGALGLFTTGGPSVTATTGQASAVGSTTATFSGSVNPGDLPTAYHFEYGPSPSFTSSTATRQAGSGSGSVSVSATVTGLKPDVTYDVRLVASNSSGGADGVSALFTTSVAGVARRRHRLGLDRADDARDAHRLGHTRRVGHEVLVRVRLHRRLRQDDAGHRCGLWHERERGLGDDQGSRARTPSTSSGSSRATRSVRAWASARWRRRPRPRASPTARRSRADEQTLERQQATVTGAKDSLSQTAATIAASATPSASTIAQDEAAVARTRPRSRRIARRSPRRR